MLFKKSSKETIIQAIGTLVKAITDIEYVDFQRQYDQSVTRDKCPGCFVNDVRIDKVHMLTDIIRNSFMIGIVGFEYAEEDEDLGTLMNAFIEQIKGAVTADRTLGGEAYSLKVDLIETDGGNRHPQCVFVIILTVVFYSSD
jgi:hypothetical protein